MGENGGEWALVVTNEQAGTYLTAHINQLFEFVLHKQVVMTTKSAITAEKKLYQLPYMPIVFKVAATDVWW